MHPTIPITTSLLLFRSIWKTSRESWSKKEWHLWGQSRLVLAKNSGVRTTALSRFKSDLFNNCYLWVIRYAMCYFSTTVRYVKGLVNMSTFHYLSSEQNVISLCTPINYCDSLNYSRHLKKPPNFISLVTAWIPICPFWQWKGNSSLWHSSTHLCLFLSKTYSSEPFT